eukprot:144179_1
MCCDDVVVIRVLEVERRPLRLPKFSILCRRWSSYGTTLLLLLAGRKLLRRGHAEHVAYDVMIEHGAWLLERVERRPRRGGRGVEERAERSLVDEAGQRHCGRTINGG